MRWLWTLVLCGCTVCASASPAQRSRGREALAASTAFAERVREDVALRGAARPDARPGDIFTPAVAEQFEKIIEKAFRGREGRNMRRTIRESDPIPNIALHVNAVYPEDIPRTTMPPTLLARLPVLPKELAYRIIGRALALQDTRTSVIVDVIPNAIPKAK